VLALQEGFEIDIIVVDVVIVVVVLTSSHVLEHTKSLGRVGDQSEWDNIKERSRHINVGQQVASFFGFGRFLVDFDSVVSARFLSSI
jgi:hypothetical protein